MGNTSLDIRDLIIDPSLSDKLQDIVKGTRSKHVMLPTSPIFKKRYLMALNLIKG